MILEYRENKYIRVMISIQFAQIRDLWRALVKRHWTFVFHKS
jgi:hypothetical protein